MVTEVPRVVTVGRVEVSDSGSERAVEKGLKGMEFYEKSNFDPQHSFTFLSFSSPQAPIANNHQAMGVYTGKQ